MHKSPFWNMLNPLLMLYIPTKPLDRPITNHTFCHAVTLTIPEPHSICSYREVDEPSGPRVFKIRFSRLSDFRFDNCRQFSTPKSRDLIQFNHHPKSIDLVEISRSVVESSKMDPSRSHFDQIQVSNEFYRID